jgi:hypothetical protein
LYLGKDDSEKIEKIISKPPALTAGWLLIVNSKGLSLDFLTSLGTDKDTIVFITYSQEEYEKLFISFDSVQFSFISVNRLKPKEEEILEYIQNSLNITHKLANMIYKRHKGYIPKIVESVLILSSLDNVRRVDILKYVQPSINLTWKDLFDHAIGVENKSISSIKELLFRYRFANKKLFTFMINRFEFYIMIQEEVFSGTLTLSNYKEYYSKNSNSASFKKFSPFDVKKAIESVGVVSYDKLILLYYLYRKNKDSSIYRLYSLITGS